jgi:hypothetical protein
MNTNVQLKTGYWREVVKTTPAQVHDYDAELDTLFIYFAPTGKERIITRFIDEHVALLYRYSDKEVVGMCIEGFEKGFLPSTPGAKVWRLSNAGVKLDGMCDIIFAVERSFPPARKFDAIDRQIKALEPVFA